MDLSAQYQQQQIASQTYNLSQAQAFDQSTQAYYAYHHQYGQYNQYSEQIQYPYYTQEYTNAYQQQTQPQQQSQDEPASIHPPGVPIPPESSYAVASEYGLGQTHVQSQQNPYYPQGAVDQQPPSGPAAAAAAAALSQLTQFTGNMDSAQRAVAGLQGQQWQGNNGRFGPVSMHGGPRPAIGQSPYRGAGRRGGRPFRGGSRGRFGSGPPFHGRGRGQVFHPNSASAPAGDPTTLIQGEATQIQGEPPQALMPLPHATGVGQGPFPVPTQGQVTPLWQPPCMAWCELCRVDCNTLEILEQHKNGKRHKKNLQVYEELQKLNKLLVGGQNEQMPVSEFNPEVSDHPDKVDISEDKQPTQENLSSQAVTDKNKVDTERQKVSEEAEPARKRRMDQFEARRPSFKSKMRGGQRGKWMRTYEGSRRPVEPPKPKEVIPLICELCNVKCESPVVFESHLTGKKHLSNLKRFQGHQAMLGQAALQALYPALQALYPALQALCQPNANASTSFAPRLHQQRIPGPQGIFSQPGPSVFSHGEALAPGPATLPASAPPVNLETQDLQNSKLQGSTSRGGSSNANIGEAKNPQQSVMMVNFEAEESGSIDAKSEYRTLKFKEEVDLLADISVVGLSENRITGAELVLPAAANPNSENGPSCEVVLPGPDDKVEKLDPKSKEPTE